MGYQGVLDALMPFVPPFLRVNAQTVEEIKVLCPSYEYLRAFLSMTTLRRLTHLSVWGGGLYVSEKLEMAPLFVMATILYAIVTNLGDKDKDSVTVDENGDVMELPSAYSIFNANRQRLTGQLTAEHFEQEIRHCGPHDIHVEEKNGMDDDGENDHDADLREAIRRSLDDVQRIKTTQHKKGRRRRRG
jgi:hypothetical protein